jgi:PAS domain S-box-containing protein
MAERFLGQVDAYVRDILLVIDGRDLRVLDANQAALIAYGYTLDELRRLTIFDIRLPDDPTLRDQAARVRDGLSMQFETLHRRKDGSVFPVEVSVSSAELDGQSVVIASCRDITERKRAEQALRDSEDRFRLFSEIAYEGVIIHDEGVIVDISPAIARMVGYEVEELIGKSIFVFAPPDAHARIAEHLRTRTPDDGFVSQGRRKDGSWFPIEVSSRLVTYHGKQMRAVNVRNISERELAERKAERSAASFRAMMDLAPFGVAVSRGANMVYVNNAFGAMLGYEAVELMGKSHLDVLPPDEKRKVGERIKANAENTEHVSRSDVRLMRKDGSIINVHVTGFSIHFDGAGASMAVFENVGEKRRLEEQLRQSQKMEAVGRLAGGVAHDFNNLLTAILGHAELLQQSLPAGSVPRRQAEQIHKAASRGSTLTGQLLAFSRKQVMQPRVLDLNAVVSGMAAMLHRLIGEDVELLEYLHPSLWRVKADPGQLEQVLMNLTVNARDAMPGGGRVIVHTRNVTLGDESPLGLPPGRYVMLEVSDSGHGMSAETRARVFEPFFTTKQRGKGTGLGLATVYGIVTQSGGMVTVESEPDEGASFRVLLPAVDDPLARTSTPSETRALQGGQETILLVEDDADVRQFIFDVLGAQGYQVLQAKDGPEAIALVEHHAGPLDLLVTDVVMPRMTGGDVAAKLSAARPSLKVLYISGYPGDTMVRQGKLASELRFLQKPFSVGELAKRVREALDGTSSTA